MKVNTIIIKKKNHRTTNYYIMRSRASNNYNLKPINDITD